MHRLRIESHGLVLGVFPELVCLSLTCYITKKLASACRLQWALLPYQLCFCSCVVFPLLFFFFATFIDFSYFTIFPRNFELDHFVELHMIKLYFPLSAFCIIYSLMLTTILWYRTISSFDRWGDWASVPTSEWLYLL